MKKPMYQLGEQVSMTIKLTHPTGVSANIDAKFFVCGIKYADQKVVYDICRQLPAEYYAGDGFVYNVPESDLF